MTNKIELEILKGILWYIKNNQDSTIMEKYEYFEYIEDTIDEIDSAFDDLESPDEICIENHRKVIEAMKNCSDYFLKCIGKTVRNLIKKIEVYQKIEDRQEKEEQEFPPKIKEKLLRLMRECQGSLMNEKDDE